MKLRGLLCGGQECLRQSHISRRLVRRDRFVRGRQSHPRLLRILLYVLSRPSQFRSQPLKILLNADAIIKYANQTCIADLDSSISKLDSILLSNNEAAIKQLKTAFGLENLAHIDDVGGALIWAISCTPDPHVKRKSAMLNNNCRARPELGSESQRSVLG